MEQKRTKTSFPFTKIEKLIKLATDNQLQFLEVDGIKIIPKSAAPVTEKFNQFEALAGASGKPFKDLSARDKEDLILFGPNGLSNSN